MTLRIVSEERKDRLAVMVAHFLGGWISKSTTANFFPDRDTFHITKEVGCSFEIWLAQLKASSS